MTCNSSRNSHTYVRYSSFVFDLYTPDIFNEFYIQMVDANAGGSSPTCVSLFQGTPHWCRHEISLVRSLTDKSCDKTLVDVLNCKPNIFYYNYTQLVDATDSENFIPMA